MISGFFNLSPNPKPILFISGDTTTPNKNQQLSLLYLRKYDFCKYQKLGNIIFIDVRKDARAENEEGQRNTICKNIDLRSISIKKHEMETW